jgi:hypothetical protein
MGIINKKAISTFLLILAILISVFPLTYKKATATAAPVYMNNQVSVSSPAYGSNISGNTTVNIVAPGLTSAMVKSWLPGGTYGSDSTVANVTLDANGNGSFVFPAESYPHGPITVRVTGTNGSISDTSYLQLYNTGGIVWNQGVPAKPPAAAGMSLVFLDDFNTRPTISSNGSGATYAAHKPGGGDFGIIPFTDPTGTGNPFSQVDSYLRIRADANQNTTGLISSLKLDGTGITAAAPAYFEARIIGPSAPGSWPAFWLMTKDTYKGVNTEPADELDTIEAYGGEGPGNPNQAYGYWNASHTWNYTSTVKGGIYKQQPMNLIGGGAGWAFTPHVYGTKVTQTDTIYYLDNIEVGRHPTTDLSKTQPLFFMLNLAAGGNGWPLDFSRYNGVVDMYVDYIRVYGTKTQLADATFAADITAPTNTDVTVTISYPDDAVVKEYKVGTSGTWTVYTAPVDVSENGTVYARGTDAAGNVSNVTNYMVSNIDKISPVSSASVSPATPNGSNGWYTSDVTVSLSASDNLSSVAKTEYRLSNSEEWKSYLEPILLTSEGKNQLQYRSIDHAGNVEETNVQTICIDKTAPNATLAANGAPFADETVYMDDQTLAFNLSVTDPLSGVASQTLTLDGQPYAVGTTVDLAGKLGVHNLHISAADQAGNVVDQTVSFKVDTSLQSIIHLIDRYIGSGDIKGALVYVLKNIVDNANVQVSKGLPNEAAKLLPEFLKHLNGNPKLLYVSDNAKAVLTTDLQALIAAWSGN